MVIRWRGNGRMKDLTSYTYYFEELIRRRFLYVDKTEYIWKMIQYSTVVYFARIPESQCAEHQVKVNSTGCTFCLV